MNNKITIDYIQKIHGECKFLYAYKQSTDRNYTASEKSPFTPLGAPLGVLIERESDGKVACYECGEWFNNIAIHSIKSHKMKEGEYKEKWGFNAFTPLCSTRTSERMKDGRQKLNEERKERWNKMVKGKDFQEKAHKKIDYKKLKQHSMEYLNKKEICPVQVQERINNLLTIDKDLKMNIARKYDSGLVNFAIMKYKSWNNFKKENNFAVNKVGGQTEEKHTRFITERSLILELRNYIQVHQKAPWKYVKKNLVTNSDFPYSGKTYIERFGSLNKMYAVAGIDKFGDTRIGYQWNVKNV